MSTNGPDPSPADVGSTAARAEMLSRLAVPRPRAHNHRPQADILREMRISGLERMLLWLSKTDVYVLSLSSQYTRMTLASLGMMVLFTSVLALGSGMYAIHSMLVDPDAPFRWLIIPILALVYAGGIMIIDREIVGAISTGLWQLAIRFLFAVGIAIAVSYPIKLKFFEQRINQEIVKLTEERNVDKLGRIREIETRGAPERAEARQQIQARIANVDREILALDEQIRIEGSAEFGRCGPRCQALQARRDTQMQLRTGAEAELGALVAPAALQVQAQQEVDRLRQEITSQAEGCYDFLCKWEAVGRIKKDPGINYEVLSGFVLGFFLLLELVPLGLKMTLGKTEYHFYLESRANLNNQKIIAINNVYMELLQNNPQAVLDVLPLEITDLMAAVMEDEAIYTGDSPIVQQLINALRTANSARTVSPPASVAATAPSTPAQPAAPAAAPEAVMAAASPTPGSGPGQRAPDTVSDPLMPRG